MPLQIGTGPRGPRGPSGVMNRLFSHSYDFDQGVGNIRKGMATVVVAKDGSGDTADIQDGIDMLPSDGGVVFIKEGTYTVTAAISITKSNVTLQGTGRGTKIASSGNIKVIDITGAGDYIQILNLYVYGSGSGNT